MLNFHQIKLDDSLFMKNDDSQKKKGKKLNINLEYRDYNHKNIVYECNNNLSGRKYVLECYATAALDVFIVAFSFFSGNFSFLHNPRKIYLCYLETNGNSFGNIMTDKFCDEPKEHAKKAQIKKS